ncbi:hypothetical protein CANARDRAFT_7910 [[Candida] arabinofermentans NRRL YB-2248]|uniref:Uncharacterized protein n=1 Tax=[Candida] arabinofermentans NRRL YB-2248 TaxID=983967 RepID=A0A1E4T0G9_9ASCO|nr:hypothetical protein CANARDRAFT_7910 [[Candida] arabinofermentans NRRL YB-2248]
MTRMVDDLMINETLNYNSLLHKKSRLPYYSDRIVLPQSILESLVNQQRTASIDILPHPLIFKLTTNEDSSSCFAGVKEFSSDEGFIELPGLLIEKLKLKVSAPLKIELVQNIPKGTDLSLKPLEIYDEIHDWKWFLEAKLNHSYTTLTNGDTIYFKDDQRLDKIYKLQICNTSPGETVSVIDTDINLDIVPLDENMAAELLRQRSKTDEIINVEINKAITVVSGQKLKVDLGDFLHLEDSAQLVIESTSDIIVSNNRYISDDSFVWSTFNSGVKQIKIGKTNQLLKSQVFMMPMDVPKATAELKVTIVDHTATEHVTESENELDSDHVICSNCNSTILKQSQFMHENFCRRNNIKCQKGCNKVFIKSSLDQHWHCCNSFGDTPEALELHNHYLHNDLSLDLDTLKSIVCPSCHDEEFKNIFELAFHKSTTCAGLLHECRFCHLLQPQGTPTTESVVAGMSQHEYECGSKTNQCSKCGRLIRLRDFETHFKLHELNRIGQAKPIKCSNINCIRIVKNVADSNAIGLCDFCYGPLYSNVNDPTLSKLKARVERRYILQLNAGCGNTWCKNPECKSSGLSPTRTMMEIINYVRTELVPLVGIGSNSDSSCSFCVDLGTTKASLAAHFIAENYQGYEFEWICKALGEVKFVNNGDISDLNRVNEWLLEYGVKKEE